MGTSRRRASRISSMHHGRVSSPLVAMSTTVSLWWMPSEKSERRSVSVDESR